MQSLLNVFKSLLKLIGRLALGLILTIGMLVGLVGDFLFGIVDVTGRLMQSLGGVWTNLTTLVAEKSANIIEGEWVSVLAD